MGDEPICTKVPFILRQYNICGNIGTGLNFGMCEQGLKIIQNYFIIGGPNGFAIVPGKGLRQNCKNACFKKYFLFQVQLVQTLIDGVQKLIKIDQLLESGDSNQICSLLIS